MIRIGSGLSTNPSAAHAAAEAYQTAAEALQGNAANLAFVFLSPHYSPAAEDIASVLCDLLGQTLPAVSAQHPAGSAVGSSEIAGDDPSTAQVIVDEQFGVTLLGCSAQAIIGQDREVEQGPALSVWLGHFPGVKMTRFALSVEYTPDGMSVVGMPLFVPDFQSALVVTDPNSFPTQSLLDGWNADHPGMPIVGGQASGGGPGQNTLILNRQVHRSGAVGILIGGDIRMRAVVSQGCKPIGNPLTVTAGEGNVIEMLGGEPPLMRLREAALALKPEEQHAVLHNLQVGLVIDEQKTQFEPGDFLVRALMNADRASGAIAIGDVVQIGQTVQFQLRDASTADHELGLMLAPLKDNPPAGALMFTCNGRGATMFNKPDHDVGALQKAAPGIPVAGMFCAGEIGPIGGRNFLHGLTASIALFEEAGLGSL